MGDTAKERVENMERRDFAKYLEESAGRVEHISCRNFFFDGVVLTNKQDMAKTTHILHVLDTTPLVLGDVVFFENSYWILFQKERKPVDSYQTFYMVKSNWLLKWVNDKGAKKESRIYVVGSKDAFIKGNFRVWNNLVTPQGNRLIELLAPDIELLKGTRFLIEGEGWSVVDHDGISVDGITFFTAVEDKVITQADDVTNEVANNASIAKFTIDIPNYTLQYSRGGAPILPIFAAYKDGALYDEIRYSSSGVITYANNTFSATVNGAGVINIEAVEDGEIKKTVSQNITITDTPVQNPFFFKGNSKIKLDRKATYTVVGYPGTLTESNIALSNDLVKFVSASGNTVTLQGNSDNKTGTVTLAVNAGGSLFTKTITVIPLW